MRANTQQLLASLAKSDRVADLLGRVESMSSAEFAGFLEDLTGEAQRLLEVMQLGTDEAFETMLAQVIKALTVKAGQLLDADRASLMLVDDRAGELFSVVTQEERGKPLEIRMPIGTGIAGHVHQSGTLLNAPDAYAVPFFNPEIDRQTGYRTRSVLCAPVRDADSRTFAVMTLINKRSGTPFDDADERTLTTLTQSIGVVLRTWHQAHRARSMLRG
jgi:adenylate cyclase